MQLTHWITKISQKSRPSTRRRRGASRRGVPAGERLEDRTLLAGTGVFTASAQTIAGTEAWDIALGDVNGDGAVDAFLANNGANRVLLNDGTGNFSDSAQSLGTMATHGVALGDLDGDGDLDAFIANSNQPDQVWINDGAGVFTNTGQSLGNSASQDVALGDFDADGDLDAFVANANDQPNTIWLNDGSGNFSDSGQSLGASHSLAVGVGDLDGDGDIDAFVGNSGTSGTKANKVYLNNGSGIFTDTGQSLSSRKTQDVALSDLDGDGDLDAFAANREAGNVIWLNDGNGTFSDSGQRLGTRDAEAIALGDLDDDGDVDAFAANRKIGSDGVNEVWLNNGTGIFTDSTQMLGASDSFGVGVGDLDGDGDLDTFVVNLSVISNHEVYFNQNQINDVVVSLPNGASYEVVIDAGDLVVRVEGGAELFRDSSSDVTALTINGSNDGETITVDLGGGTLASGFALTIHADGGDDVVNLLGLPTGFDGAVDVFGQTGHDLLDASALDAGVMLHGGAGDDTLTGGSGDDQLIGNADVDRLNGRRGRDTLDGGPGGDFLFGGAGRDLVDAGPGDDFVNGHGGHDTLTGGDGADTLVGSGGSNLLREAADVDFLLTDTALVGRGGDVLIGIQRAELTGGNGDNTLDARDFTGRVTLAGGAGADSLIGGHERDYLHGGQGNDTLNGRDGNDRLFGSDGNDALSGMGGNDKMFGGNDVDTLLGGDGDDTVQGQLGDDIALGGPGVDSVNGNNGTDTVAGGGNGIASDVNDTVIGETIDDDFIFDAPWVNV